MQHVPCSISVSPSVNQPVLACAATGHADPATFRAPPCRSSAASRRHPPLRLSRCVCALRTRAQASLGDSSASGEGKVKEAVDDKQPSMNFFDRTLEQEALQTRLACAPTGIPSRWVSAAHRSLAGKPERFQRRDSGGHQAAGQAGAHDGAAQGGSGDEANMLIKCQEGDEGSRKELDLLLGLLVQVTKQESQAHVVLASSDDRFAAWLAEAVGDKFFEVEVVGDFPKDEARKFFAREVFKTAAQAPVLPDATWEKVYEVCGGNHGDFRKVAFKLSSAPSLEEVDAALFGVRSYIKVARAATSGQGWAPRQYLTAVQQLLQSDHGAVIASDLRTALGDGGDAALLAMVEEGLLGLREPSGWACDLPPEAYGNEELPVVTAASAAHLHCMWRLFGDRGEGAAERLQALDGKQAAPTEGSSADSPAQEELRRDIAKVGDEIEAVKATKEEGWQEEVSALRKEKELLLLRR